MTDDRRRHRGTSGSRQPGRAAGIRDHAARFARAPLVATGGGRDASRAGLVMGALWMVLSFTPSLLPRPWWLQGVIAALSGACGYMLGWAIGRVTRAAARWVGLTWSIDPHRERTLRHVGVGLLVAFVFAFPAVTIGWQRFVTAYVGRPAPGWWYPVGASLTAIVVATVLVWVWRRMEALSAMVLRQVSSRIVRATLARAVASVVTVALVVAGLNLVVQPAVMAVVNHNAAVVNEREPRGLAAPASALRSGGPGSPHSWQSLGQDGMTFVSTGPTAARIRSVTHRPAVEPVRVFVGNGSADTIAAKAELVVAELDRTRAWSRRAIVLATPTSTGYVNRWSVASVEYLLDGDVATASLAYSDLPSAWGLLTARDDPPSAGRALLDAVRTRLASIPVGRRPKLYVTGESLGAYGAEGAFGSPAEMARLVDGAVFSGTPGFSRNRARLTAERSPGSTTIVPVVDDGATFRFAGDADELAADEYGRRLGPWGHPRIAYLQHPSDPVVWWSTDLLVESPQWLRETRRGTPMAQMSWTPLVTFWQVSADMLVSNDVPGGFGHRYKGGDMVPAWGAVLDVSRTGRQLDAIANAVGRR